MSVIVIRDAYSFPAPAIHFFTAFVFTDPPNKGTIPATANPNSPAVVTGRAGAGVYAGRVVLVGDAATPEQREKFVEDTRSVDSVLAVRSYIQLKAEQYSLQLSASPGAFHFGQ